MGTFPYDPVDSAGFKDSTMTGVDGSSPAPLHFNAQQAGFELVTRGRRGLAVSLIAQDIVALDSGQAVSRRVRRIIRHTGGEAGLHAARRRCETVGPMAGR